MSADLTVPVVAWIRNHPDGALSNEMLTDEAIEQVRRDSGAWRPLILGGDHLAVVASLSARLEAAERDAARYRMVRRGQAWSVIDGIGEELRADALDAAIDAASQEGNG